MYGSRVMKGEELHNAVISVFNDTDNLPAMSRGFAGHHQVVCSVLEHDGDNTYLKEKSVRFPSMKSRGCHPRQDGKTV